MYIDFHADSIMKVLENKGDFKSGNFSCNLNSLIDKKIFAQFYAIYLPEEDYFKKVGLYPISDFSYIDKCLKIMNDEINSLDKIKVSFSYEDFLKNLENNVTSVFYTIENGRVLDGKIENLDLLYEKGIRLITLTHNFENSLGYSHFELDRHLKEFGRIVAEAMMKKHMIVDVSHLSDAGFYDVCEISKKSRVPFMASHSNARSVTNVSRNMTDDMIKNLSNSGGIMGLNFCSYFLTETDKDFSRVSDMVRHLKHINNIAGEDVMAIGTDFDGIGGILEIDSPYKMDLLWDALSKNGFKESTIEKIFYRNAKRFLKDTLI